jgi:hypothetical protein
MARGPIGRRGTLFLARRSTRQAAAVAAPPGIQINKWSIDEHDSRTA